MPSVGNQMLEMKVSGRIDRLTNTGADSALAMNRVTPMPSVVNAAVPSISVRISPGSVAGLHVNAVGRCAEPEHEDRHQAARSRPSSRSGPPRMPTAAAACPASA